MVLMGMGIAPILIAPQKVARKAGESRRRQSTRCSASTPSSRRALPARLTISWSWAYVISPSSVKKAVLPPRPSSTWRSTKKLAALKRSGISNGDTAIALAPPLRAGAPGPGLRARRRSRLRGLDGHGLDLDQQLGLHQPRDDEQGVGRIDAAGKILREELAPGLHEAVDVRGMGEEGLEPHHVGHGAARRREHGPHVLEGLRGLGDHVPRSRHLAGAGGAHPPPHD